MSETPEVTAELLNSLLLQYDKLVEGDDLYLSLEEFAIGQPVTNRPLDLCWGYASVEANSQSLAEYEVVIGRGITRSTTSNVTKQINRVNYDFTGLNLTDLLPNNQYQNIYAFGSIFVSPGDDSGLIKNPTSVIEAVLLKGESGGYPLFMTHDLEINNILRMIRDEEIPAAIKPDNNSIEIFRFVLEINYYSTNDYTTKDVKMHFLDKRKPRGWGGFAEEALAATITPFLIYKKEDYATFLNAFDNNIYNLIKSWINLRYWSPNFLDYWQNPSNSVLMPDRLKDYLKIKFSITI